MHDRLGGIEPDLVVVGGGINGAGVARDAALRGFRVLLLEKDDFGAGASSKTSKLVHGGLRYLEYGALRLVWEACRERRLLLRLAPHLVRPLPCVFPVYRGARIGPLRLAAGMWLYDLLAAFRNVRRHRLLSPRRAAAWSDGLRRDGLRGAALYYDAVMDDARLVLANVLSAREAGAVTLNGVEAVRLCVDEGRVTGVEVREVASGATARVCAPCVVGALGPWTNSFLGQLSGAPRPLAPTRGTHLVVRLLAEQAFTLAAGRDGRIFFVLPWLGLTLIGTTDVEDEGDADRVAPTSEEIDYLLSEVERYLPAAGLQRTDVVGVFAGLRPLLCAAGETSARSREHAILEPAAGLLVVAGGKYTTYRAVAEQVVDRIAGRLGRRGACRTAREPLPGGDLGWSAADHWSGGPGFEAAVRECAREHEVLPGAARHVLATYGSRARMVLEHLRRDPGLAAPLCPHQPHLRAEVVHALRVEMALHLDDWFLRRSHMAYGDCHGLDAVDGVADLFAAELGWSRERRAAEVARCRSILEGAGLSRSPASSRAL